MCENAVVSVGPCKADHNQKIIEGLVPDSRRLFESIKCSKQAADPISKLKAMGLFDVDDFFETAI